MSKKSTASQKREVLITSAISGLIGIVLAYAFLSRAFSTGSYWQYFLAVTFFVLGTKILIRVLKKIYGKNY